MTADVIAKAAEIVGWEWDGELKAYYFGPGAGYWHPTPTGPDRADLHALCGLLEDWVRETLKWYELYTEQVPDRGRCWVIGGTKEGITLDAREITNPDPLMARLEALVKLAEELNQ